MISDTQITIAELELEDVEPVYSLLEHCGPVDTRDCLRTVWSKDYIMWYFQNTSRDLRLGLIYHDKIVGFVAAHIQSYLLDGKSFAIGQIALLCLETRVRDLGLAGFLIKTIVHRLHQTKCQKIVAISPQIHREIPSKNIIALRYFMIPIRQAKLRDLCIIKNSFDYPSVPTNVLHMMRKTDIESVASSLNTFYHRQRLRPVFDEKFVTNILTKKRIVYTFVCRDSRGIVTDMISVQQRYRIMLHSGDEISEAVVMYYFYQTLSLTQLILYLRDKLLQYDFDEILFDNANHNLEIDVERLPLTDPAFIHMYGFDAPPDALRDVTLAY